MNKTKIEWTDGTWNWSSGCKHVSPGCANCYAQEISRRFSKPGLYYAGVIGSTGKFNGAIKINHAKILAPLRWIKPAKVFVNSMSDTFHENVPDEVLDQVFAVMALCSHITFQIVTKRAKRMQQYLSHPDVSLRVQEMALFFAGNEAHKQAPRFDWIYDDPIQRRLQWPQNNVWVGVSAENQKMADERIPLLLDTPAKIRFISAEPLLGPIDLSRWPLQGKPGWPGLNWVIVGGESGPSARPMHPDWARILRDQCAAKGVPYFFKQWGEWAPRARYSSEWMESDEIAGKWDGVCFRYGKKIAGNVLGGKTYQQFPRERSQ